MARTGRGLARGEVGAGGAGVIGANMEELAPTGATMVDWAPIGAVGANVAEWEGEVGREKAVKGLMGGSRGEIGGGFPPGSGRDWRLPLIGWLEMIPGLGKYPANGRLGGNIEAVVETASKDEAIAADSDVVSAIDDVTVASACSLTIVLSVTSFTFSTFSSTVAAVVATGASMTS